MSLYANSLRVVDSWYNTISGFGAALTKARSNRVAAPTMLSAEELGWLYDGQWLAQRIVDTLPAFAMRDDLIVSNPEALARYREINHPNTEPGGVVEHALSMGRLFGGAALLLGANGGELLAPIGQGESLDWLDVIPRHQLRGSMLDADPSSATFGQAMLFEIIGTHRRKGTRLHRSRLVFCEGRSVASESLMLSRTERVAGFPEWLSVLQSVQDALADYDLTWTGVSQLISEASIGVMSMRGVIDLIASKEQNVLLSRLAMLSDARSVAKTILLDSEGEKFERSAVSFADLPQIMAQISQRMAGAAEVPATILFGMSPAGLNATGESDLRQFYDRCERYRRVSVLPKLKRIFDIIAPGTTIEFPPIWTPTETEREATRNARANADRTWFDLGVVTAEEIRASRAADDTLGIAIDPSANVGLTGAETTEEPTATEAPATFTLAPTDIARIVTVNEARRSVNQPPLMTPNGQPDPDGRLTIVEFSAKREANANAEAEIQIQTAEVPDPVNGNTTAPQPGPVNPGP